jgi:hypothetical protein
MNIDKLYGYIKSLKDSDINFKHQNISEGDRYLSENGNEYTFEILGNKYSVGYVYITEDDDDWAQAECYQSNWCQCNDKNVTADEVYQLIVNYKSIIRDSKLNEIGL